MRIICQPAPERLRASPAPHNDNAAVPMKILILASYFAPYNVIAAHRITALARFLHRNGHDIKIITVRHEALAEDLRADVEGIDVIRPNLSVFPYASNWKAWFVRSEKRWGKQRGKSLSGSDTIEDSRLGRVTEVLKSTIRNLLCLRDDWVVLTLPMALQTIHRWRPNLIYASSPPPTCMVIGSVTSTLTNVPWVCEIRDRWADDPYYPRPRWRKAGERALERAMLGSARGIVTVSETWARDYSARYGKPAIAVYSGIDPEVYRRASSRPTPGLPLRLIYTGSVYAGRDPTPLWRALAAMGTTANDIRVEFYGARRNEVLPGAAAHGVSHLVHVEEYVSHDRAVELQCGADVLLLLQWDNPSEAGNIPGKLFEYIGAGRPILAMGYAQGEMAQVITESGAGICENDPAKIVRKLGEWLMQKQNPERQNAIRRSQQNQFTRNAQFQKLEKYLCGR